MPIPDYQTLMLPVLRFLKDGKEHNLAEAVEAVSREFNLSPDEGKQLLASSNYVTVIGNRTAWAHTYLKKASLIESARRGFFRITERGKSVLASKPSRIDGKFLAQFPEFIAFRQLRHERSEEPPETVGTQGAVTPEEALDSAYQRIRLDLEAELLEQVKASSAAFFERLVVELLVQMGYGGSLRDAGKALGKSGDGGIDGTIKEDPLGLDVIYIQAKKWDSTVGRPEIQKFAGALQGHRARKGVFITTADFSSEAKDFATRIDSKIVLIDGVRLAKYMIDHNVGVSISRSYDVKKIDSDYFIEE